VTNARRSTAAASTTATASSTLPTTARAPATRSSSTATTTAGGDRCDGKNDLDTDGDGVLDPGDDCRDQPNADQLDTDDDSVGNACDGDDQPEDAGDRPADPLEENEDGDACCRGTASRRRRRLT
jgi:hypothetical protein